MYFPSKNIKLLKLIVKQKLAKTGAQEKKYPSIRRQNLAQLLVRWPRLEPTAMVNLMFKKQHSYQLCFSFSNWNCKRSL